MKALTTHPWFASLPEPLREAVLRAATRRRLAPGEVLFRQGDPPGEWHAVISGMVKASTLRSDGAEAILAVLEPGNWFGEVSLLDDAPRTHDATAVGPTEVLCLPAADFHALMQQAGFATALARLMAGRIRTLYGVIEDATLRSTRARVARRIALLVHGDVTLAQEGRREVRLSQEALAMMLGLTRQTLSKELKALAAQGALRLGYRCIEIVSFEALSAAWVEPDRAAG